MRGFLFGLGAMMLCLSGMYLTLATGVEPYDPIDKKTVIASRMFLSGMVMMAASFFV